MVQDSTCTLFDHQKDDDDDDDDDDGNDVSIHADNDDARRPIEGSAVQVIQSV